MSPRKTFVALVIISLIVSVGGAVRADVTMPPFFSDHMVLQRDGKAPIWGTAEPGEKVTVRFRDQEQQTSADAQGNWRVELKGLKAGGPDELTIAGKNTITLTDVLVGEVWVGSGQSNMEGSVGLYYKKDPALEQMMSTAYPQIRGYNGKNGGGWKVATPQSSVMPRRSWTGNATFSALLFSMAVRLHEELNVPVGMMLGAVGGTPSGAWLSPEALAADNPSQKQMAEYAGAYPAALKEYEDRLARYEQEEAKLKAEGNTMARGPSAPPYPPGTVHGKPIGHLYALYIKPFVGYGIRGVLWDQGEAGTRVGGVDQYTMMGALIRGWRNEWNIGEFPFIYVQKPSGYGCSWNSPTAAPGTPLGKPRSDVIQPFIPLPDRVSGGGLDGENYVKMMKYPNVGMVISTDLVAGIHPIIKSAYGNRAAKVALGIVYGKPVEYYGPMYASHAIDGNVVRVTFTHVGKGLTMRHSEKLQGFAVAGDDKVFHWAEAKIDGDTVVLSSPDVARPTAVRYAWGWYTPWANFFNKDGLPAVSFRTDAW